MPAPLITSAGNATPPWFPGGLVPANLGSSTLGPGLVPLTQNQTVNNQTPYGPQPVPQVSSNLQAGQSQTPQIPEQQQTLTNPTQQGFTDIQQILNLFQPQQTPQQQMFQAQQQAALDRLTGLEQQLSQSSQTTPELTELRKQITEQQKALKNLTPEKYLQSQPGLKGMEVTQQFLERRVAQERDPIASTLSELLTSESILSQSQQTNRQSILDQANLIANETEMRASLQKLQPQTGLAGLPEGIQSKLMEQFLGLNKPTAPTGIQEYEYAKAQGFKGTYLDYQRATANLNQSSTTTNAAITQSIQGALSKSKGTDGFADPGVYLAQRKASNMSVVDFDKQFANYLSSAEQKRLGIAVPGNVNLTPAQKEDLTTLDTVSGLATQALSLGLKTGFSGTGGFYTGSLSQFLAKNLGTGSKEGQDLRNLIGNIKGTVAKLRGGTSFTTNEEKLLDSYVPTINDSALVIQSKLEGLQKFI